MVSIILIDIASFLSSPVLSDYFEHKDSKTKVIDLLISSYNSLLIIILESCYSVIEEISSECLILTLDDLSNVTGLLCDYFLPDIPLLFKHDEFKLRAEWSVFGCFDNDDKDDFFIFQKSFIFIYD